ncbi:MAG: hypothetical protein HUU38_27425 [Anaerolineales bacterium]|nr:hypothetical protein [Anaerolineales bacterium]
MKKTLLLLITLLVLSGTAWFLYQRNSPEAVNALVPTPEPISDLFPERPPVSDEIAAKVQEALAWTLNTQPFEEISLIDETSFSWLTMYLISSGEFETTEITLEKGEKLWVDVVYAYFLNQAKEVFLIPLVIGVQTETGLYAYLSDSYLNEQGGKVSVSTALNREAALQDAQKRLSAGVQIRITAYQSVHPTEIIWEECPDYMVDFRQLPAQICDVGQILEQKHPGYLTLLIARAVNGIPTDWMLIGWFSFEPEVDAISFDER